MNITAKTIISALSSLCASAAIASPTWLPADNTTTAGGNIRLLDCSYDGPSLLEVDDIAEGKSRWKTEIVSENVEGGTLTTYIFVAREAMAQAGVAVAVDMSPWSSDNYVMIPACVYNGNRQRIVNRSYAQGLDPSDYGRSDLQLTSNPIPQLSPDFGAPSHLEVSVCNAATPGVLVYDRAADISHLYLTDQGIETGEGIIDHVYHLEESSDRSRATLAIAAPGVRARKAEFIGFGESPDRGMSFARGDTVRVRLMHLSRQCSDVTEAIAMFSADRKRMTAASSREPRKLMPMSKIVDIMSRNIDSRFYKNDSIGFYRPEDADWMAYGWIGGLINTYPMLAADDTGRRQRVTQTFDFALPRGRGASGYYYDVVGADGNVVLRDASAVVPGISLTRRNGDVLYWMLKQFDLLHRQGHGETIRQEWEKEIWKRRVCLTPSGTRDLTLRAK